MSFEFMGKKVVVRKDPIPQQSPVVFYASMGDRFVKKTIVLEKSLWVHLEKIKVYPGGGRVNASTLEKDGESGAMNLVYASGHMGNSAPLEQLAGLHVVIDAEGLWLHGTKIADRITSERIVFLPLAVNAALGQWRYRPDRHDDWGFIRDASGAPVARVVVQADDWLLTRHQENQTDPCEGLGKRLALFPEMALELNRSFVGLCREFGYISVKERFPGLVRTMKTLNGEVDDQ